MSDLIEGVLNGRYRAIARLITQVENSEAAAETAVTQLHAHTGNAHIIGITGPPGSGKSTLGLVIMGHPNYEVTEGEILMNGENMSEMCPVSSARRGRGRPPVWAGWR